MVPACLLQFTHHNTNSASPSPRHWFFHLSVLLLSTPVASLLAAVSTLLLSSVAALLLAALLLSTVASLLRPSEPTLLLRPSKAALLRSSIAALLLLSSISSLLAAEAALLSSVTALLSSTVLSLRGSVSATALLLFSLPLSLSLVLVVVAMMLSLALSAIPTLWRTLSIAALSAALSAALVVATLLAAVATLLLSTIAALLWELAALLSAAILLIVCLVRLRHSLSLCALAVDVVQPFGLYQLVHLRCSHGGQHLLRELVVDRQALRLLLVLVGFHCLVGGGTCDKLVRPRRLVVLRLLLVVDLVMVTHQSVPDTPDSSTAEESKQAGQLLRIPVRRTGRGNVRAWLTCCRSRESARQ